MAPMSEVLRTAARDPDLSPSAVRVFLLLHDLLDADEFRPVKIAWVIRQARISMPTAIIALRRLHTCGYVVRANGRRPGQIYHYRLGQKSTAQV